MTPSSVPELVLPTKELESQRCQALRLCSCELREPWRIPRHSNDTGRAMLTRGRTCSECRGTSQCLNIYPYSCIRVMVPSSPHMAWVDPGEGTFTCQVNRSITVSIEPGPPRRESGAMTSTLLRLNRLMRRNNLALNKGSYNKGQG